MEERDSAIHSPQDSGTYEIYDPTNETAVPLELPPGVSRFRLSSDGTEVFLLSIDEGSDIWTLEFK